MTFSLAPGSWLWLFLALLALGALAAWAYRFALPPLAPGTRRALFALRAVALAGIALLFARPLLSLAERGGRREVIVLEDRSLSMTLPGDSTGAKREVIAARAAADVARRLAGRYRVRRWVFASQAFDASADSARTLDRASSALGDALAAAGDNPNLAAVVVVTDGVANRGRDPVQAARELGRPVSAVAVGATGGWDASVEEVALNPTARAGQSTPMEVRLRHTGPASRRARLTVRDETQVLADRQVTLPAGGEETVEDLTLVPRRPGLAYYRVRLEAGPGEITDLNNHRAAVQSVLPDRQRILVLTSNLNWDWTWLKRSLDADSSWSVEHALVRQGRLAPVGAGRVKAPSSGALAPYAVVIAQGLSAADAQGGLGARLAEYARGGGGLAIWSGEGAGGSSLAALAGSPLFRSLGIEIAPGGTGSEISPELPAGNLSDVARIDDDPETARRLFSGFPPLTGVAGLVPRAGDEVAVTGLGGRVPLLVLRRAGRGRLLIVNGSGLWRWGFAGDAAAARQRYDRLWGNAVRALAEPTQSEPLRVAADRPLFSQGESAPVTASLQDERFQPIDGAEIEARLESVAGIDGGPPPRAPAGAIRLTSQGGGTYAGRWDALAPGRYRIQAVARTGGRTRATATSEFLVDRWSPEYAAADPDRRTLERMAQASGGVVSTPARVADLTRRVASHAASVGRLREHRLWESPLAYVALVTALSAEWFVRRKRGLP